MPTAPATSPAPDLPPAPAVGALAAARALGRAARADRLALDDLLALVESLAGRAGGGRVAPERDAALLHLWRAARHEYQATPAPPPR